MRYKMIKSILDEIKKKSKKQTPISRLYSSNPVFSDHTVRVPEGIEGPKQNKQFWKTVTIDNENKFLEDTETKETELDEEGGLSDTLGANTSQNVPKWEDGITRGHANPIDFKKAWQSGITRGKANSLFEGLNLSKKQDREYYTDEAKIAIDDQIVKVYLCGYNYDGGGMWQWYYDRNKIIDWCGRQQELAVKVPDMEFYQATIYVTKGDDHHITNELERFLETRDFFTLNEGLNRPKKKDLKPTIFEHLDNTLVRMVRADESNKGRNVFRFYPDMSNQNMLIKAIVDPSGKVAILWHRISFIANILEQFDLTREAFDEIFHDWFYIRHGNQIIREGLNLTKKDFNQEVIDISDVIKKYKAKHWIYNPEWYQQLPDSIQLQLPYKYYDLGYIVSMDGFLVQFKSHYDPKFIEVDIFVVQDGEIINVWHGHLNADKGMNHFDIALQKRLHDSRNKLTEGLNLPKKHTTIERFPDDWCNEILSDGTFNPIDLIPKYLYYLSQYTWPLKVQHKIEKLENEWKTLNEMIDNDDAQGIDYWEQCGWILDDLESLMENLAPKGCWFGRSEYDGTVIGFWKYEDEDAEDMDTDD